MSLIRDFNDRDMKEGDILMKEGQTFVIQSVERSADGAIAFIGVKRLKTTTFWIWPIFILSAIGFAALAWFIHT